MNTRFFIFCFLLITSAWFDSRLDAQIAVGAWRDHLPYYNVTNLVSTGSKIFCSSPYATFYYNPSDFSVAKLSRSNGLSDIGVSAINYNTQNSILLVAFDNANIDIIKGTEISNLSDIKNKQIQGDKKIYQIVFKDNLAYLACGFGIVVVDIQRKEIKETYYIGPNASSISVLSILFDDNFIYAATSSGIYRALKNNPNLIDYQQWEKLSNLPLSNAVYTHLVTYNSNVYACMLRSSDTTSIVYRQISDSWEEFYSPGKKINNLKVFNNRLYVVEESAISIFNSAQSIETRITDYGFAGTSPNDIYVAEDGTLCIGDKYYGLVLKNSASSFQSIIPNSPYSNHVAEIDAQQNLVAAVGGGHTSYGANLGRYAEMYLFKDENWSSQILWTSDARDFSTILINPYNPSQIFAGAWGAGIYVFENNQLTTNYNAQNSTLRSILQGQNYIRIGGMGIDPNQNLYVTNVGVSSPISVRTADGSWYSYNYSELASGGDVGKIIITQSGLKWVLLRGGGLFVFDDNETPSNLNDDLHKRFSIYDESGQFITNQVYSIAEDKNGVVWVGTDQGVFTYYNPESILTENAYYASRVKVTDPDNPDIVQYLLAKEKIMAITIDGANRKWFGTESSGVFLLSDNCEKEIFHFTKENSRLLSNNVTCIAIEPKSGEVFMGTDIGIDSYKGTATEGDDLFSNAYIYPNPVRENYEGNITITGLANDADVKITDIAGQLVYQTKAFGGQAIWNGKNHSGKRVKTGVYLVFCTDEEGLAKKILKLLFIN